jgi:PAS domain-containing protein
MRAATSRCSTARVWKSAPASVMRWSRRNTTGCCRKLSFIDPDWPIAAPRLLSQIGIQCRYDVQQLHRSRRGGGCISRQRKEEWSVVSAALSESQRLLFLIDHSLDFVEFLGDGGTIKGVSGAIKTLGGYDPEQLIGTHYQDILHPQDCAAAAAAFGRVLRGAGSTDYPPIPPSRRDLENRPSQRP